MNAQALRTKRIRTPVVRVVIGLFLLSVCQAVIVAQSSASQCTACAGPNQPRAGIATESCSGIDQLAIIDELNPSGNFYRPAGGRFPTADHVSCHLRNPDGSLGPRCTDLRVGCCPDPLRGFFMCNIVIQPDCSFRSVCAARCCGDAEAVPTTPVGDCPLVGIRLGCRS